MKLNIDDITYGDSILSSRNSHYQPILSNNNLWVGSLLSIETSLLNPIEERFEFWITPDDLQKIISVYKDWSYLTGTDYVSRDIDGVDVFYEAIISDTIEQFVERFNLVSAMGVEIYVGSFEEDINDRS
jgi:hypothetical protein